MAMLIILSNAAESWIVDVALIGLLIITFLEVFVNHLKTVIAAVVDLFKQLK